MYAAELPVHPRVCGEHSYHKILIRNKFHIVKERTNLFPTFYLKKCVAL